VSDPYSELRRKWTQQQQAPPATDPYANLRKKWGGSAPPAAQAPPPPLPPGQSLRAATPDEIRGMATGDTPAQRYAAQYLSPEQMARVGISPAGMRLPPAPNAAQRLVGSFAQGYIQGGTAPLPIAKEPAPFTQTATERAAQTIGQIAGFSVGPAGTMVLKIGGMIVPKVVAPIVARVLRQGGAGAVYNVMDALVTHHNELLRMPPKEAAKALALQASIGAAEWTAYGATLEALVKVAHLTGPPLISAIRARQPGHRLR